MDLSVAEYARKRGISRQRALSMINAGQVAAVRVGRAWVINEREVENRSAIGRPLSPRMAGLLIDSISGQSLSTLKPDDRYFIRRYRDRLQNSEDPSVLLHSWLKSRQKRVLEVAGNPADLPEVSRDSRAVASGISDPRSGLSGGREIERYISERDLKQYLNDNLLVSSSAPNVRLHVVEKAPSSPVPIGLVLADLADWNRPREDGQVREMLKGIEWRL